jgi:hypothetical protein
LRGLGGFVRSRGHGHGKPRPAVHLGSHGRRRHATHSKDGWRQVNVRNRKRHRAVGSNARAPTTAQGRCIMPIL